MRTDSKQHQFRNDTNPRAASPRRRWLRQAQQVPKSVRLCVIAVVAFCAAVGFARALRDMHDQYTKTRATTFPKFLDHNKLWSPKHPIRYGNGSHIDDRYAYSRHLGGGQEGSVDFYIDQERGETVAVKRMSTVGRNSIPAELLGDFIEVTDSWPTEIEAGLLLADEKATQPYVQILDYFVLQSPSGWNWAMVTPFVADGTLLNLAAKAREKGGRTIHDLDREYRPVVERLLQNLQSLHATGLCHDDIKPDNIFLRNSTSWLLGDLGSVRHVNHPWHSTASWIRQNQWRDCQLNDVRRVLKTYLSFLRGSSPDEDVYDDAFWHHYGTWSTMFWDFEHHPVGAGRMADLSQNLYRPRELDGAARGVKEGIQTRGGMAKATERELLCTSLPSRLWFVPVPG